MDVPEPEPEPDAEPEAEGVNIGVADGVPSVGLFPTFAFKSPNPKPNSNLLLAILSSNSLCRARRDRLAKLGPLGAFFMARGSDGRGVDVGMGGVELELAGAGGGVGVGVKVDVEGRGGDVEVAVMVIKGNGVLVEETETKVGVVETGMGICVGVEEADDVAKSLTFEDIDIVGRGG